MEKPGWCRLEGWVSSLFAYPFCAAHCQAFISSPEFLEFQVSELNFSFLLGISCLPGLLSSVLAIMFPISVVTHLQLQFKNYGDTSDSSFLLVIHISSFGHQHLPGLLPLLPVLILPSPSESSSVLTRNMI